MNRYKINAWLLCHDVRLLNEISTIVEVEKEPLETDVWKLLESAANKVLEERNGLGCQYELDSIKITKLLS